MNNHRRFVCSAPLFLGVFGIGCANTVDELVKADSEIAFGAYTKTDPRWERLKVGAIAIFKDAKDANPVILDTGTWMSAIGLKQQPDMDAMIKAACDSKGMCTIASKEETYKGIEANFNAKLGTFEVNGRAIRAQSSSAFIAEKFIFRTSNGTDAIAEWNKFRSSSAYAAFFDSVKKAKGNLSGKLVVVSRVDLAFSGWMEFKLNSELSADAQAQMLNKLELAKTNFKVVFNKDTLRLETTPSSPFVLGWRLDEISA
jgi:hypothetical protein